MKPLKLNGKAKDVIRQLQEMAYAEKIVYEMDFSGHLAIVEMSKN